MYASVVKHVLLPFGEILRGSRVLPRLRELEKSQWYSPERIRELQEKKLRRLVRHAYDHVPYYRRVFGERGLGPDDILTVEDLTKLPILTKKEARRQFPDQITADNCTERDYLRLHSSGSTGEPLHFHLSREGHDARLAAMFRYWRAAGYDFGQPWVRAGHHAHTRSADRATDRLVRCTYLQFREANERELLAQLDAIRKARPVMIRTYASAAYLFARTARDNGIKDIRVKATICTGSVLYDHYRQLIESQFKGPVYDVYGGEGMIIAGQFECGSYHIHAEGVIAEFLKPDGTAVGPGELGSIVLTNLNNHAMPFIRYEIGDLGVTSNTICTCGRGLPVLDSIVGRDSGIVVAPNGRYLTVHFFNDIFRSTNVVQFQIVQNEPERIELKLVRGDQFSRADKEYIIQAMRAGGGTAFKVEMTFVEAIPPAPSGKRLLILSKVGQQRLRAGLA
ncbi:phenylacetate--CoA ligase family protein [Chloroflexota bacterium]